MTDERNKPAPLRRFSHRKGKNKYKTLRRSVLDPLLITISVMCAVMILFFNVVILLMLYSNMVSDLSSMSGTVEQLAEAREATADDPAVLLALYKDEVERRAISYRTNMILLDRDGRITRAAFDFYRNEREIIESGLPAGIVHNPSEPGRLRTEDDLLLFQRAELPGETGCEVYLYASARSQLGIVRSGNQALLIILALCVLCFVLASHIIAGNISRPIKALSDRMDVIGDGDFTPISLPDSSAEVHKLIVSINEMMAKLQAYNTAHTISLQNLSHDLRTPLMSIGGYAEAIKYGVMESDEAADIIIRESRRLTGVVEKLLILSELDTFNQPVDLVPVKLCEFLTEELQRLEGYAMKNGITVSLRTERETAAVLADRELFSTIIQNLISNAVRYAEQEVSVTVHDTESETVISVADDGRGLSAQDLDHLFTRYYVGETGHSGLGLSTAKSAAEYMGCRLSGRNRSTLPPDSPFAGKTGAVFTVSFPKYE